MTTPYWVSPKEANLLITGKCNLRCKHCSVTSHGELNTDLPLSSWIKILNELQRSKLIKLTITGGEPFFRSDFSEFLGEIYKRPFRFSINTNATLVTDNTVKVIKKYSSRFDEFMVSLDGPDKATVDNQRGSGVFEKLVAGVKKIQKANLPFGYYCTVTSLNVDKLNATAQFALSTGARWIKFNNFLLAGPGLNTNMIPDHNKVLKAAENLSSLAAKFPGIIQGTLLEMKDLSIKCKNSALPVRKDRAYSCGAGLGKVAIFPDGRVTPCDHLPQFTLGDITKQSLEEILTGKEMKKFTKFLNQKRSDYHECKDCIYINFCSGGCPVEAVNLHKSIGIDRHSCLKIALGEK